MTVPEQHKSTGNLQWRVRMSQRLILLALLMIVPLFKGGMLDIVPLSLSIVLILALICQPKHPFTAVDRAWLNVWIVFTLVTLAHLILIPVLVSWNAPLTAVTGIELNFSAVNLPATLGTWIIFNCSLAFSYWVSKLSKQMIRFGLLTILFALIWQTLYAVFSVLTDKQTILWIWPKTYYLGSATGTFVNHNHFANYLAICFPFAATALYLNSSKVETLRQKVIPLFSSAALAVFILSALILSQSRMGVAIGVLGIIASLYLLVGQQKAMPAVAKVIALAAIVIVVLSAASVVGIDDIARRYERVFGHDMRWDVWPAMFELPLSMWLLGSGGGTFFDVYLSVHPAWIHRTAYNAHNDYLQYLLEFGIIGGSAILIFFARLWKQRPKPTTQWPIEQKISLLVIVLMAIHSTVDFSIRIPANAIIFWFAFGVLMNGAITENSTKRRIRVKRRRNSKGVRKAARASHSN